METINETETPTTSTEPEIGTDKEPSSAKAPADERNETWEKNHKVISEELHRFMKRHERIPTKTELAEKTGLSRFTIHKHLKEYNSEAIVKQEEETFRMMRSTVLASMFNYAMYGDARAARVYFDVVDGRREK